jgi:4'-phosphopantetheinyl transferase
MSVALPDGHAHVWILPIGAPRPDLLGASRRLLSEDEGARAARFHFERDRVTFVLSHALVRTAISAYADVAPGDWTFRTNEHGCPFVSGPAGHEWLRFNLSHADGCAAVVVARDRDVGIDVEPLGRRAVDLAIAERYFAPAEVDDVMSAPPDRRQQVFLEIWTLKEAYIKARGVGLSLGLHDFTCRRAGGGSPPSIAFAAALSDDSAVWQMGQFTPTPVHVGALAVRREPGHEVAIEIRQLETRPGADVS